MGNKPGNKLSGDLTYHNTDCGGTRAGDPGKSSSAATYVAGSVISVEWSTNAAHASPPGVRWSISYDTINLNFEPLASGLDVGAAGVHGTTLTLDPSRSGPAVLQFQWVTTSDNGGYIGCSDITIEAAPVPPTQSPTPSPPSSSGAGGDGPKTKTSTVSGGGAFVASLSCVAFVYGVGGMLYNYRKQGRLSHPHKEQWTKAVASAKSAATKCSAGFTSRAGPRLGSGKGEAGGAKGPATTLRKTTAGGQQQQGANVILASVVVGGGGGGGYGASKGGYAAGEKVAEESFRPPAHARGGGGAPPVGKPEKPPPKPPKPPLKPPRSGDIV